MEAALILYGLRRQLLNGPYPIPLTGARVRGICEICENGGIWTCRCAPLQGHAQDNYESGCHSNGASL